MQSAVAVDRLQFAFTVTFHYIFPQLTMGLALLIVILKTLALRTGNDHYNRAARFYKLTPKGRKKLFVETSKWHKLSAAIVRILNPLPGGN